MSKVININKKINPDISKHRDKYSSNIEYSFADRLNYVMLVRNKQLSFEDESSVEKAIMRQILFEPDLQTLLPLKDYDSPS